MDKQISEIHKLIFAEEVPQIMKRKAMSIVMKETGIETSKISKVVGVSDRRVLEYLKQYKEKGNDSIYADNRYKPKSELEQYNEIIKADFEKQLPATANEAVERIKELTGLKRSPTQVRKYMHRLGMRPLKVAPIPAKANPDEQEKFLDEEIQPRLEEAKAGKRIVLFCDASHFVLQAFLGMLWCFTRQFIPSPSGRQRLNVLGAYNPLTQKLITVINTTYITATTIEELFKKVRSEWSTELITIILDNAKYQKCDKVFQSAKDLNIELLYLPTYSPNLNLIERLWRFIKKDCLYSKYYKNFKEFREAIENSISEVDKSKKEKVKNLITLKFQLFNKEKKIA